MFNAKVCYYMSLWWVLHFTFKGLKLVVIHMCFWCLQGTVSANNVVCRSYSISYHKGLWHQVNGRILNHLITSDCPLTQMPQMGLEYWTPIYGCLNVVWCIRTPPKINIEPENDGFEDDFPFPGVYSQVPCYYLPGYKSSGWGHGVNGPSSPNAGEL